MQIRLILQDAGSGPWNMGVDEALLDRAAAAGRPVLRIYRWAEPTLSLGYFQAASDRQRHRESAPCPLVRRSTGGGAIVHDRELTYSFAWAAPPRGDLRPFYDLFHLSLRDTLRALGADAQLFEAPPSSPSPSSEPFLCFQRRANGDLLLEGHKIGGSAQRRRRGGALQHGSLLWNRSPQAPQLPGIAELCPRLAEVDVEHFQQQWLARLEQEGHTLLQDDLSPDECSDATRYAESRFTSDAWNAKR